MKHPGPDPTDRHVMTMTTTSSFFARLRGVADDLDNGLRSLTVKQNVLARRGNRGQDKHLSVAAQKAEVSERMDGWMVDMTVEVVVTPDELFPQDLLEEATTTSSSLCRVRSTVKAETETLENFLADTTRQAKDMMEAVRRQEAWGEQYGSVQSISHFLCSYYWNTRTCCDKNIILK